MRHPLGITFLGILALAFVGLPACGGSGGGGTPGSGSTSIGETGVRILMTDAPTDLQNVFVNIVDIAVHQPGGPWQSLGLTAISEDTDHDGIDDIVVEGDGSLTVDLLALRGTTAMLASSSLAPGKYTMIRFIVSGDGTAVTQSGDTITLKIPSGTKTGIKIGETFVVQAGFMTDVLLDWDAEASVKIQGQSGKGILKPTIRSPESTPASLRWELLSPTTRPGARQSHDMVFDQAQDVIVLYGGLNGATFADTWEFDPKTDVWTLMDAASPPGERRRHRMTYDAARGRTVMFGGFLVSAGSNVNDTWEYVSGSWTEVATASAPSARFAHDMDFDQKRGVTVLFGKNGGGNETWEYDGTDWTLKNPATKPAARGGAAMAYDSIDEVIVLFGGKGTAAAGKPLYNDLWSYNGVDWTLISPDGAAGAPPKRTKLDMAFDASRNQIVIFGGKGASNAVLGDTLEYDGASWVQTFAAGDPSVPSVRFSQAMVVYDDHRNRVALFGGKDGGGNSLDDLWVYGWLPLDL